MMVYDNIVNAMRHTEYGISVKDRRYRFVKYKNCFIGSQAVEWLCNGVPDLKRDRKRAVKLGQKLLRQGFFTHCLNAHDFKDKFLFYTFNEDVKKWWTIDLETTITHMISDHRLVGQSARLQITGKALVDWCLQNMNEQIGTERFNVGNDPNER